MRTISAPEPLPDRWHAPDYRRKNLVRSGQPLTNTVNKVRGRNGLELFQSREFSRVNHSIMRCVLLSLKRDYPLRCLPKKWMHQTIGKPGVGSEKSAYWDHWKGKKRKLCTNLKNFWLAKNFPNTTTGFLNLWFHMAEAASVDWYLSLKTVPHGNSPLPVAFTNGEGMFLAHLMACLDSFRNEDAQFVIAASRLFTKEARQFGEGQFYAG